MGVTKREALTVLAVAYVLITAGLVWLFGPYGLIGAGAALAAVALFGIDVREARHEAVASPPRRRHRVPVHHR